MQDFSTINSLIKPQTLTKPTVRISQSVWLDIPITTGVKKVQDDVCVNDPLWYLYEFDSSWKPTINSWNNLGNYPPLKLTVCTWKWMVGIWLSHFGPILRGYLLLFSGRVCSHDNFMTGRSIKQETGIFLGMVKDMIFPSPDDVGHISREIPGTPEE